MVRGLIMGGGDKTGIVDCVRANWFYQQLTKCKPSGRPLDNNLGTKSVWLDGSDDIENGRLELHLKSTSDILFPRIPVTWMG